MEIKKKILIALCLLFLFSSVHLPKDPFSENEKVFIIRSGEGSKEIAQNLEKEGIIRWSLVFRAYVLATGISDNLQAGSYSLSSSKSVFQIARKLKKGEIVQKKITIPEGWSLRDIGNYFEEKEIAKSQELWDVTGIPAQDYSKSEKLIPPKDFSAEFEFLKDKSKSVGLEGYLFPDTYVVIPGEGNVEIVRKMLSNFDKKLTPELRAEIARQQKSIFDIITMASIIEKEVMNDEDRKTVSGIFWKRLSAGMPLQACPSVNYVTGKKSTQITKEEMEIDSPFNTYKYAGLPLGPISNPGLKSIEAAIYPTKSSYWYFLNRQDTGETVFSKNLTEHNIATAKYLR
ncbi:MAG: endolytic transglycosylase MltG [Candidatus Pacebacteria bacterium]|nr:endolytic transglycosylase MltG [Candidatus Paceibacterota bacterium]